jgi:ferredoxin-thioredoxin reductase catalytic subunit
MCSFEERFKKVLEFSEEYAKKAGIKLNPDKKIVENVIKGLLKNEEKFGFRYCPCRVVEGDLEKDRKKICPCSWHLEEIKKFGHCLCGLFVKK